MDCVKIGGVDREIRLPMVKVGKLIAMYNSIYSRAAGDFVRKHKREPKGGDSINFPPMFFYYAIWKCLIKRGIWPFKKPFRSLRKMISEIEIDEAGDLINFVGKRMLRMKEFESDGDDKKKH